MLSHRKLGHHAMHVLQTIGLVALLDKIAISFPGPNSGVVRASTQLNREYRINECVNKSCLGLQTGGSSLGYKGHVCYLSALSKISSPINACNLSLGALEDKGLLVRSSNLPHVQILA